jgi:hypothetical protein
MKRAIASVCRHWRARDHRVSLTLAFATATDARRDGLIEADQLE